MFRGSDFISFSLVCLIVFSGPTSGEELTLSLPEAIELALRNNFSLASRQLEMTYPEIQLQIAQSDFRWNVRPNFLMEKREDQNASATAGMRAERQFSPGTLFEISASWTGRDNGENGEQVDLRMEQPLFQNFGKLSAYRFVDEADFQLKSARLRFQRETENLILRVVNSYTLALNQSEKLKLEMHALIRAADLVRLVEVKQRQGRATGVDVLEMKMLHQEAELRFRQAEERLIQSRADLAELVGRVHDQLPDLEEVALAEEMLPSLTEAGQIARNHRAERFQALLVYENARRNLQLEERERYPDVRLLGNWRPVSEVNESEWFAGIAAGQNLDPHVIRLRIAQEENQVQAALLQIAAIELQLSREVLQAHSRLRTIDQELEIAESQLQLSRERLRMANGLFPSGRVSSLQLRDAEEEWVQAQTKKTDASLQQIRARYEFWYVLGRLLGSSSGTEELN